MSRTTFISVAILLLLGGSIQAQSMGHDESVKTYRSVPGNPTMGALNEPTIQKDLELVEAQLKELTSIRQDMFREIQRLANELNEKNASLSADELIGARKDFRIFVQSQTKSYEDR